MTKSNQRPTWTCLHCGASNPKPGKYTAKPVWLDIVCPHCKARGLQAIAPLVGQPPKRITTACKECRSISTVTITASPEGFSTRVVSGGTIDPIF